MNFLDEIVYNRNSRPLVSLNETNVKNMLKRHSTNGYIIVNPCRGIDDFLKSENFKELWPSTKISKMYNIDQMSNDEIGEIKIVKEWLAKWNQDRVKEFLVDLRSTPFRYVPVYGGFEEEGSGVVYERSFMIFAETMRKNEIVDFEDLYNFGLKMIRKYNQDSMLVQRPNEKPKYVNQNGDDDMVFSGNLSFNDINQIYFTDLHKNTHKYKNDMQNRSPSRFSFSESYINPKPASYQEGHIRWHKHEICIGIGDNETTKNQTFDEFVKNKKISRD